MNKFIAAIFIFSLTISSAVFAHTPSDPNLLQPDISAQWKTLETAHFRIHHQVEQKEYAQNFAALAERVHVKLTAQLDWQPWDKTEVTILDTTDLVNGYASPLLYNRMGIFMPTPVNGQLAGHHDWMERLFTHEYTHILQLDMAGSGARSIRRVFGRMGNVFAFTTFPQLFAPGWVTEGFATYSESKNSLDGDKNIGRLNSAWYEALMRMEVQRGLRSLTEVSFDSNTRWPYGLKYLYGAYFFEFVEARYGPERVRLYIEIYGDNFFPWRMETRSKKVFGKSAELVWAEFQQYLKQRFEPQLARIKQQATTNSRTLYDAPYINSFLAAAGNGDLYFYHDDASSHPEMRRLRADGGKMESLFEVNFVSDVDWHDDAGMLLSRGAICDNTNGYTDLYRWRPEFKKPERLTHCARYARAAWRKDGQAIAAVQLEQDLNHLVLLDAAGKNPQRLDTFPSGDALGDFAWSPDHKKLVASVLRKNTGWNLELFDLQSQQWQRLTSHAEMEMRPRFSNDGSEIYFISDHEKIWNLRRMKIGINQIETLSNTLSAVTEAVEMPDKSFSVLEHISTGTAIIALQPTVISSAARSIQTQFEKEDVAEASPPAPYTNVKDYSPLPTLRPRSWFPLIDRNENSTSFFGAIINGADALGFHQWSAIPLYYDEQKQLGGLVAYNFYNKLFVSAQRQFLADDVGAAPPLLRDEETRYQVLAQHSFNSLGSSITLAAGVASEKIKVEAVANNRLLQTFNDTITGAIISYDNTEFYKHSISAVDGRQVNIIAETYDGIGKSFYSGNTTRLEWSEYIGLGGNHALQLKAHGASGGSGIRPYQLGGESETISALGGQTGLARRDFPLRGYPTGLASLTGTNFGIATLEWRIPLGMVYDGMFVPPLGIGRHSLTLFAESGDAWNVNEKSQFKSSAGVEWNVETLIGYDLLGLDMTLGFAHGFNVDGDDHVYLKVGLPR